MGGRVTGKGCRLDGLELEPDAFVSCDYLSTVCACACRLCYNDSGHYYIVGWSGLITTQRVHSRLIPRPFDRVPFTRESAPTVR